jgi:hypothetical protein
MLHMHPEQLALSLEHLLDRKLKKGHGVVLIYGDCCVQMAAMEAKPGVVRIPSNNCCQLLLGREAYRRLSSEGAFFLIPEWARRWREIFTKELGLNRTNATSFMQDIHRKLVYLDTRLVPIPEEELLACAQYCGLPFEVRPISLDNLRASIEEALNTQETMDSAKS